MIEAFLFFLFFDHGTPYIATLTDTMVSFINICRDNNITSIFKMFHKSVTNDKQSAI